MATKIRLREICYSRSGDKGSDVNVGIAVYDQKHYEWMKEHVTEEAMAEYLNETHFESVTRYELPKIGALNFMIRGGLTGGASMSLMLDGHGKSWSSILLDMQIAAPE